MIRLWLPKGLDFGNGDQTFSAKICARHAGNRCHDGDINGSKPMPGLQEAIDCDDRPNRSHEYGLSQVRQRRSHEDGSLEVGRQ
jgi:hypothetical protein